MNKEVLNKAYAEIEDFTKKLGETFYDAVQEDTNFTLDMARGIIGVFSTDCQSAKDYEIAESILMAICGYKFESLVEKIKRRDEEGYLWESC